MKWTRWTGVFATTLGCIITYSHPGSFALHFPMYPIQILLLTFKAATDWQSHIFQTSSFPWPVLLIVPRFRINTIRVAKPQRIFTKVKEKNLVLKFEVQM